MEKRKKSKLPILIIILLIIILSIGYRFYLSKDKNNNSVVSNSNITNSDNNSNNNSNTSNIENISNINSNNNIENISNSNENTISNSNQNSNNSNKVNSNSNKTNHTSSITSNKSSNKTSNKTSNTSNTSNTKTLNTNGLFSGIFQKNNLKITIFQNKSSKMHYRIVNTSTGRQYIGKADINNKKAIGTINYTYTFTLNNTGLQLSTTDPNKELNGNYNKISNYTYRNYYSDYIGDLKYENSIYNGIFTGEKGTIKLYQSNSKEVVINMKINNKTYNQTLDIDNGKLVHSDTNGNIDITIENDTLKVISSSPSAVHPLFSATGTYTRSKKYTIEQIVDDRF